jgi:hypothetical protein
MTPVKANQGIGTSTTIVDDILVELRHATTYALVASTQALLLTNGTAACTFSTAPNGSFYVVVKHRSAIETWSSNPVVIAASSSYNFTNAANKAFGNNMREIEPGIFAFYNGDINQDNTIDNTDSDALLADVSISNFGELSTDLNGDGSVDNSDTDLFFINLENSVFASFPE